MMNIVVPMAGLGSRFIKEGYATPKPFIDVAGKSMIERVLENLALPQARFILITRIEYVSDYSDVFDRLSKQYTLTVRTSDEVTDGPASTVFLAADLINTPEPLLVANSDQLVDIAMSDYIQDSEARQLDGSILTFPSTDPKWSYAAVNDEGLVQEVKEKVVISPHATVGIYYLHHGSDFVSAAALMMAKRDRTNNEFYVCPAYMYLITAGKRIGIFSIEQDEMHGLGTPADLNQYIAQHAPEEQAAAL